MIHDHDMVIFRFRIFIFCIRYVRTWAQCINYNLYAYIFNYYTYWNGCSFSVCAVLLVRDARSMKSLIIHPIHAVQQWNLLK